MNIQWYPGHMAKAKKEIKENLKLVDVVVEILDARIPYSSQNPDIKEITEGKPRIVALNKADLALEAVTREWVNFFKNQGLKAVSIDSLTGKGINKVEEAARELMKDKMEKSVEKGRIGRPIRLAILGIPNVGKSQYINKNAKKNVAITGDRPGVTKQKQWVRAGQGIELLDTPGVLWPKFDNDEVGLNLAFTGAIRFEILDTVELAFKLADRLRNEYGTNICERYKLKDISQKSGDEIVSMIGSKRGCLISGGEIDMERAANLFIDEFRSAKLGKISLEKPKDI